MRKEGSSNKITSHIKLKVPDEEILPTDHLDRVMFNHLHQEHKYYKFLVQDRFRCCTVRVFGLGR